MLSLAVFGALAFCHGHAFPPGPSCNHEDGDYPGCGLSKITHSSSQPIAGKTFLSKYFPVQAPGDECTDDVCDCSATSSHAAWHIYQGRVYTTREIDPSSSSGGDPGNGFGLHLVDVPAHLTTGGLATEEVEAHFTSKLGDMTTFDSFMDFNAILATSGLQKYKDTFKADGVKYFIGTWIDGNGTDYASVIVQVPGSQLILELVQQTSLTYEEDEAQPVKLEQRVPDIALSTQKKRLAAVDVVSSNSHVGSYIVSLGINRAASAKAMAKLEDFYVDGMGTTKTHDATHSGVSKKCFLWPGASGNICFTSRPDSATAGDWKVADFEDMLNTVHENIIGSHPSCPLDRWFDNHYAIDSQSLDSSKMLSYVNSKNPYHICANGGTSAIFDPTGLGIQIDAGMSAANDCPSTEVVSNSTRGLKGGKYNPSCTTDSSKCASGLFRPTENLIV